MTDNWLCKKVEDLENEVQRLTYMLDRTGVRLGSNANLHGSNWEVSDSQIAQWVPGTTLPLGDTSEYARFKDGVLEVRGGSVDIKTSNPNGDALLLNEDGIILIQADESGNFIQWRYGTVDDSRALSAMSAGWGGDAADDNVMTVQALKYTISPWNAAQLVLRAWNQDTSADVRVSVHSDNYVTIQSGTLFITGNIAVNRNSTNYTGYVFVPLETFATSTDFDGDLYDEDNDGAVIDLSASFGLPAGIKAVSLALWSTCATPGKDFSLRRGSGSLPAVVAYTQVANQVSFASGVVPCDANGDIFFTTTAVHGAECAVYIRINGYWI